LTGRVSVRTHPWLAECVVAGVVVLPGSAVLDMVIRAGDEVGCPVVVELVIDSPVVVGDGVVVQVMVEVCGEDGRHDVRMYSRAGDDDRGVWVCHARATLAPPRKSAECLPVTVGSTITEVVLEQDVAGFGIHPILVEAALAGQCVDADEVMLPAVWKDVVLHACGAQALRVQITPTGPVTVSLLACDDDDQPVLSVGSLEFRAMPVGQLSAGQPDAAVVGLVRSARRVVPDRPVSKSSLIQRLAGLSQVDQERELLDLVRTQAADVLGYSRGEVAEAKAAFKDLGFDSLTAVQLRNQIAAATGLSLPATILFDHPTPAVLSRVLWDEMFSVAQTGSVTVLHDLDRLEAVPVGVLDERFRSSVIARFQRIMSRWSDTKVSSEGFDEGASVASKIQSATASEVLDFIDRELGRAAN
jgi:acyl carrier protein